MKSAFAVAVLGMLMLTACGIPLYSVPDTTETTNIPEYMDEISEMSEDSMISPEPTEKIQLSDDMHIVDMCGVLDDEVLAHYNAYLQDMAENRHIYTAVIITDTLNGKQPEQFAAECYHEAFGTDTNGFLLLINNDTGEDAYYLEGVCTEYMADTTMPLAQATPYLIEGNYTTALDILLILGERVPEA